MPIPEKQKNEAQSWKIRIANSHRTYKVWEKEMKCKTLEAFFEGDQWPDDFNRNNPAAAKYVTNLFFSAIETKVPSILFGSPVFTITPRPSNQDVNPEIAMEKARLKQDFLNTYVSDPKIDFTDNMEQVAYDAFFRFGVVEVGYAANWVENPNAGKPVLKSDRTPYIEKDGTVIKQPDSLPESERIFVKSIDPKNFRVGGLDTRNINNCSWVGYSEYVRLEDVLALPGIGKVKREAMMTSAGRSPDFIENLDGEPEDVIKIWYIFDNRAKEKLILPDGVDVILRRTSYKRLPIFMFAPIRRTKKRSAYPVPIASQWTSPQVEYNEAREMQRAHRQRFVRRFLAQQDIPEDELDKVLHGGDGAYALVQDPSNSVVAIPSAPLDSAAATSMVVSKDDFNVVSASTTEIMAASDRVTATQSVITDRRSSIRENRSRVQYAEFLNKIAKEIIQQAIEKLTEPLFIKRFVDSQETLFQEIKQLASTWQKIRVETMEYGDFAVVVKISSLSPIANEEQKSKLFEFLAIISNYPQIALVPALLQAVAEILGFNDNRIIKQLQEMAMLQMAGQMQQGGMGQRQQAKSSPGQMEQITNQLENQVGLV